MHFAFIIFYFFVLLITKCNNKLYPGKYRDTLGLCIDAFNASFKALPARLRQSQKTGIVLNQKHSLGARR